MTIIVVIGHNRMDARPLIRVGLPAVSEDASASVVVTRSSSRVLANSNRPRTAACNSTTICYTYLIINHVSFM